MTTTKDAAESEINTYTSTFINDKGKKIFCKYWEPVQKPRALVFVAHGFAEHCLPYDKLSRILAAKGFFVFSHDHVGHGQSGGSRVHVESFSHYVKDVFQHIDLMEKKSPNLSVFLCGHSMGGAISILAALEKPEVIKGVLLIAPAVSTNPLVATPFKITMARMLRWIVPHFPIGTLDYSMCCSCPNGVKILNEDPLRWHGFCKAGFGACLIDTCQEIQEKAATIAFPFILLQGDDDKICPSAGATMLFEKAAAKDKTIKMYPKAYHSLLLEPNGIAEQVTEDIVEWLTARA